MIYWRRISGAFEASNNGATRAYSACKSRLIPALIAIGHVTLLSPLLVALQVGNGLAPAPPVFSGCFEPISPYTQNQNMRRGVNVLGYDPVWNEPAKVRFSPRYFKIVHDAGFQTVRIPLHSFDHLSQSGKLDYNWLATLDTMVVAALKEDLTVVLDEHDNKHCHENVPACERQLAAVWAQISDRYKKSPNRLIFELLNEPPEYVPDDVWNDVLLRLLAVVRSTNPERNVIIGPGHWYGLESLPHLALPLGDEHLIVTFHYYHPGRFTHQGAPFMERYRSLSNVSWGSPSDYDRLAKELDAAKAWGMAHRRPLFLGEFGTYDTVPMQFRTKWISAVARGAEIRGFSWAYWQFDTDFKLYDFNKHEFVMPVLDALVPKG